MDQNTKDILDTVNFIKDHMLTKEEGVTKEEMRELVREEVSGVVRDELRTIRHELKAIREELDVLATRVENISGFRKEIDHALERIGAIEKHLGMERKMAA